MKRPCIVIFPLYKPPSEIELNFLENGSRKLGNYDQVIVCPENLSIDKKYGKLKSLPIVRFSNNYFECIQGYNNLMLSNDFYKTFEKYEYILIHQPDVYVFKNELEYWCSRKYDYVGAPWIRKKDNSLKKSFIAVRKLIQPSYGRRHNKVGNGGFSLRKVDRFIQVLESVPENIISNYQNKKHKAYNEDVFWSIEAERVHPQFRVAPIKEAINFGIEFQPEIGYEMNSKQLPFGCHAPEIHGPQFWKKFIPILRTTEVTLQHETGNR